jgi:hypothetical protein
MTDIDWPEREGDMALIRQVNGLMHEAARAGSLDECCSAFSAAEALLPAYAAATRRFNAAVRTFLAGRMANGSAATH